MAVCPQCRLEHAASGNLKTQVGDERLRELPGPAIDTKNVLSIQLVPEDHAFNTDEVVAPPGIEGIGRFREDGQLDATIDRASVGRHLPLSHIRPGTYRA